MRNDLRNARSLVLPLALWLGACGGSSPPAATPSESAALPSASASAGAVTQSPPAAGSSEPARDPGKAKETETAAPPAAASTTSKLARTPRDILELKDTVFFLAFDDSDPKKDADAACSKSAGTSRAKMSACLAKARQSIEAEGHRFEKDKAGDMWWLVVRLKGNAIVTVHKVRFSYGAQTDSTIAIEPEGKDVGSKPWKKPPTEMKFEVPTEYRLIVRDPVHGKLVYEAKSGITGSK
jgi:hypothetical protein